MINKQKIATIFENIKFTKPKIKIKRSAESLRHLRENLNSKLSDDLHISLTKSIKKEFYRKLIHLSSLWIPALIYFIPEGQAIVLLSIIFLSDAILEYGNYKKWPWARKSFGLIFFKTLRKKELNRNIFQVTGSMYVLFSAIVCTMFFSKPIAVVALTIMLVSDTCAALFGKAYGTRHLRNNKTLEGTTALFVSALLIMVVFNPILPVTYAGILACFAATLAELYEDKIEIDDNLAIPLFIGLILSILG
ncbi:MAG: phosphatidate cytidylyltransferase [Alphaproteobacteria bacterium]|nr:phosphatidate cytidylyltransferase [Alphaproteobacteria bacterium]MBQ8678082.1 phosphatidate cytidylyltransferase [Alphaproteobacteria bacterium]